MNTPCSVDPTHDEKDSTGELLSDHQPGLLQLSLSLNNYLRPGTLDKERERTKRERERCVAIGTEVMNKRKRQETEEEGEKEGNKGEGKGGKETGEGYLSWKVEDGTKD